MELNSRFGGSRSPSSERCSQSFCLPAAKRPDIEF